LVPKLTIDLRSISCGAEEALEDDGVTRGAKPTLKQRHAGLAPGAGRRVRSHFAPTLAGGPRTAPKAYRPVVGLTETVRTRINGCHPCVNVFGCNGVSGRASRGVAGSS